MHPCLPSRPLIPDDSEEDDVEFCRRLTIEAGVTAIPVRLSSRCWHTYVCFKDTGARQKSQSPTYLGHAGQCILCQQEPSALTDTLLLLQRG